MSICVIFWVFFPLAASSALISNEKKIPQYDFTPELSYVFPVLEIEDIITSADSSDLEETDEADGLLYSQIDHVNFYSEQLAHDFLSNQTDLILNNANYINLVYLSLLLIFLLSIWHLANFFTHFWQQKKTMNMRRASKSPVLEMAKVGEDLLDFESLDALQVEEAGNKEISILNNDVFEQQIISIRERGTLNGNECSSGFLATQKILQRIEHLRSKPERFYSFEDNRLSAYGAFLDQQYEQSALYLEAAIKAPQINDVEISHTMLLYGLVLGQLKNTESEEAQYDVLISRFDGLNDSDIELNVAKAYFYKGLIHCEVLENPIKAISIYKEFIHHYDASNVDLIKGQIASAHHQIGLQFFKLAKQQCSDEEKLNKSLKHFNKARTLNAGVNDALLLAHTAYVQWLLRDVKEVAANMRQALIMEGGWLYHRILEDILIDDVASDNSIIKLVNAIWDEVGVEVQILLADAKQDMINILGFDALKASQESQMILQSVLGFDEDWLATHTQHKVNFTDSQMYQERLMKRMNGKPLLSIMNNSEI